ncbi:hypothetical protein SAMN05428961_1024 [Paenibacillus sp. OK060]|nr:hypothetical protein SAMN05428961_1024 [Paenibacillus sp. OK060]
MPTNRFSIEIFNLYQTSLPKNHLTRFKLSFEAVESNKVEKSLSFTDNGFSNYKIINDGDEVIYETDENNKTLREYTWDDSGSPVAMAKDGQTCYCRGTITWSH